MSTSTTTGVMVTRWDVNTVEGAFSNIAIWLWVWYMTGIWVRKSGAEHRLAALDGLELLPIYDSSFSPTASFDSRNHIPPVDICLIYAPAGGRGQPRSSAINLTRRIGRRHSNWISAAQWHACLSAAFFTSGVNILRLPSPCLAIDQTPLPEPPPLLQPFSLLTLSHHSGA